MNEEIQIILNFILIFIVFIMSLIQEVRISKLEKRR